MAIQYRPLTVADAEQCVALRKAMLTNAPASFGSSPEDDRGSDLAQVRERLQPSTQHATLGAFDASAGLIGTVGVGVHTKRKAKHKASIWGMYVAPEFRRRGVARRLMQDAIAFAQSAPGVATLQLSVSTSAPGAQQLYESLGFTVWGTEPDALRIDGRSYDERHLSLAL
ncbi:MAG: GNAT family N-acetyltransferase [Phycisphaerales bacterium JB063]